MDNPELELAWNFVEKTNKNLFLTGKAGTGKTTFLHKISEQSFKRLVVVAPTGVAAINAKGVTIHSFFQMPFGPILPDQFEKEQKYSQHQNDNSRFKHKFNRRKIDIIRSLDLLIIDEISMVRADLLDGIDQVLRKYRDKKKAFGGIQVLMIGDLQQLAPVVKADEWQLLSPHYSTPFFFSSKAFQESNALGIELKHIYRQENQKFIDILNEIRNNRLSEQSLEILNARYDKDFKPDPNEGYITLTTHNASADRINDKELSELKGKSHFYEADVKGDFPEYSYPTHANLELKVGAQVMFIKNDSSPEKRYFNGKIGRITSIEEDQVVVHCPGDDEDIYTDTETWENIKYTINSKTKEISEDIKGTFTQLPLRLAWAITIHKSQGLTFEKAIIDAASSFAHGQAYVALSRCKTLEGIVLKSKLRKSAIIQDRKVLSFTEKVEEEQPDGKQLNQSQKNYQLELIRELFDYKPFFPLVYRCRKVVEDSSGSIQGNLIEPIKDIKEKGIQPLVEIGENFQKQLRRLSTNTEIPENQPEIQDRFKKAIPYFIKHTEEFFVNPLNDINFTTDNLEFKKLLQKALKNLEGHLSQKLYCLNGLKDGFSTMKYLEVRAKSVLQEVKTSTASTKEKPIGSRPELFAMLKELRNELAQKENVRYYQIFTQKSLLEMCEKLPIHEEELLEINGMGKFRTQKYGEEILDIIRFYCVENNEVLHKKSPAKKQPKENTRDISFKMFKDGKNIQEIAKERGLVISTIESHLATLILEGKVKLDEIMTPERSGKLKKSIQNIEFESVSELRSKLNEEYSYSEIRMVLNDMQYHQNN